MNSARLALSDPYDLCMADGLSKEIESSPPGLTRRRVVVLAAWLIGLVAAVGFRAWGVSDGGPTFWPVWIGCSLFFVVATVGCLAWGLWKDRQVRDNEPVE